MHEDFGVVDMQAKVSCQQDVKTLQILQFRTLDNSHTWNDLCPQDTGSFDNLIIVIIFIVLLFYQPLKYRLITAMKGENESEQRAFEYFLTNSGLMCLYK